MHQFYLICPIGMQELLATEIKWKCELYFPNEDYKIIEISGGGVLLEAPLSLGLSLNQVLRTAARVLLRLKTQKCRDIPKLFNIIKKLSWKDYLKQENIKFVISSKESRLINTSKIEKACLDGIKAYFNANKISQKKLLTDAKEQAIYLRLSQDELTISLDSTGDHLYHRHQDYKGIASIRATHAASLLLFMLEQKNYQDYQLIDPMCGSGTFLNEAQNFFSINKRGFSFQNWNLDQEKDKLLDDHKSLWDFKNYCGFDLIDLSEKYETLFSFKQQNFFKLGQQGDHDIYILNPPYGKRVKIAGDKIEYFQSIIDHCRDHLKAAKLGLIIPSSFSMKFNADSRLKFNQNGIMVEFLVFDFR